MKNKNIKNGLIIFQSRGKLLISFAAPEVKGGLHRGR